jgi:hypothetical protein
MERITNEILFHFLGTRNPSQIQICGFINKLLEDVGTMRRCIKFSEKIYNEGCMLTEQEKTIKK